MIAVIGGIKVKIEIKMGLPEAPQQNDWTAELEDEGHREESYESIQSRMMAEHDKFWNGEGSGRNADGMFGGVDMIDGDKDEINVKNCGCAFNVAKHLAAIGRDVAVVSVIGADPLGFAAEAELSAGGIDVSHISKVPGQTPLVFELKNFAGEVEFARAHEQLFSKITPELIEANSCVLDNAEAIMLDGSIPAETIAYITERYGERIRIFYDPASRAGGFKVNGNQEKGSEIMRKTHCVMPGRAEAEKMADMVILGPDQLKLAGDFFTEHGIDRIFITMKGGGVYYIDRAEYMDSEAEKGFGTVRPKKILRFAETSGAGDVVSAVIVDETLKGSDVASTAEAAMTAAAEFLKDIPDERPY